MSRKESAASTLDDILKYHLSKAENYHGDKQNELEVRFGTKSKNKITKIQFENVIRALKSHGFMCYSERGESMLKIQSEFVDIKTGKTKLSNVRFIITGDTTIQNYCKTNSLEKIGDYNLKYESKSYAKQGDALFYPIDNSDFNMRFSYQTESKMTERTPIIKEAKRGWDDSKKSFRYVNRLTYTNSEYPLKIDMSITKMSQRKRSSDGLYYKIAESGVFQAPEMYEIEIELDNSILGPYSYYNSPEKLKEAIKKTIKIVLSGLQNTNYPVSYSQQKDALNNYANLIGIAKKELHEYKPKEFCGPASYTLELKNIQPHKAKEAMNIPNIRDDYTVTDKADGLRKLLFVDVDGKIYFITTNIEIEFSGFLVTDKSLFNSLLDGEHILHNKTGGFINLYAAFDIYYIAGKSVREKAFMPLNTEDERTNFRLVLLNNYMGALNKSLRCITDKGGARSKEALPIRFSVKNFYTGSIFESCRILLEKEQDQLFEYETDGLIFTPARFGVGGNKVGESSKPMKVTWEHSFKWKPPEYNTIDFLVTTKKNKMGQDMVSNTFVDGENMANNEQLTQFKTLMLRCGYDEKKHGMLDPANNVYEDKIRERDFDNTDSYKPVLFYPTEPYDNEAHLCDIVLKKDANYVSQMICENGDIIENNMIVEFRYDITREKRKRWIPLNVRYDKTAEFRAGQRNYGNAYHVANSNWHSIHHPVTVDMLSTGANIPDEVSDVYYNRKFDEKHTESLRDFHNLVVKRRLIVDVSKKGDTLIDFAVGKGGDLAKWTAARLSFVFGIDVSQDNLENKIDGACARYINFKRDHRYVPDALFVTGDSGRNIRDGVAIDSEKQREITYQVFASKPKTEKYGKGVEKSYGRGKNGFDMSVCMFALHYFFKDTQTLENFVKNVSECTKVGGHFVGCCFDGKKLFEVLKTKARGEGVVLRKKHRGEDKKIWELIKDYEQDVFEDDESSLGYTVSVYQDSINKYFDEYLVNFDYFERVMENQGFKLLTREEEADVGFPASSANFKTLFEQTRIKAEQDSYYRRKIGKTLSMNDNEKYISFMNRYFIFKKVLDVPIKKVKLGEEVDQVELKSMTQQLSKANTQSKSQDKGRVKDKGRRTKKLKKKLVIED